MAVRGVSPPPPSRYSHPAFSASDYVSRRRRGGAPISLRSARRERAGSVEYKGVTAVGAAALYGVGVGFPVPVRAAKPIGHARERRRPWPRSQCSESAPAPPGGGGGGGGGRTPSVRDMTCAASRREQPGDAYVHSTHYEARAAGVQPPRRNFGDSPRHFKPRHPL